MGEEKPKGITRRHFLRNVLGVAGVIVGVSAIPGGYFAYKEVSSRLATGRALSVIDILDSNYTCKNLADDLVNPQDLAVNPLDSKVYFVQKQTSEYHDLSGLSEWVYELTNGKIRKTKFWGAGDPWGGIHTTLIAINSRNQICVCNTDFFGTGLNIFDLATQEKIESLPVGNTKREERQRRMKEGGFDYDHFYFRLERRDVFRSSFVRDEGVVKERHGKKIEYSSKTIGEAGSLIARVREGLSIKGLDLDEKGDIYFTISEDSMIWNKKGKIIQISKK